MNQIKEFIYDYWMTTMKDYLPIKGYHQLDINIDDLLIITIRCNSSDNIINKFIPLFKDEWYLFIPSFLLSLNKTFIDYEFIIHELIVKSNEIIMKVKPQLYYLDVLQIPIELIKLILNYVQNDDYLNVLDVLRLYNHSNMIKELSKLIIVKNESINYTILNDEPVMIKQNLINGNQIIYNINGEVLSLDNHLNDSFSI